MHQVCCLKWFRVYDNSIMFVSVCLLTFLSASSTAAAKVPRVLQAFWSGSVLRWRKVTRRQCFSFSCLLFTSSSVTTVRCEKCFLMLVSNILYLSLELILRESMSFCSASPRALKCSLFSFVEMCIIRSKGKHNRAIQYSKTFKMVDKISEFLFDNWRSRPFFTYAAIIKMLKRNLINFFCMWASLYSTRTEFFFLFTIQSKCFFLSQMLALIYFLPEMWMKEC